jgi:hypothetical protein
MRSFSFHDHGKSIFSDDDGMCVARLIKTSCPHIARATASRSKRSSGVVFAPAFASAVSRSGFRPAAVTS